MTSLQTKVESIKSALGSASTCTAATVTLLNELLSPKPISKAIETGPNPNPTLKEGSVPKSRTKRATKPTIQDAATYKVGEFHGEELSPKEKAILSTEVINTTLKVLNIPGKVESSKRLQPSIANIKGSPRRRVLRRSTSLPLSPFEQRSLDRVSSSPNVGTRSIRSSSSASMTSSSYRGLAECARVAFGCMRSLQFSRIPCMMDMPPLQLESGMSALIGKLIMLGLDELAMKELRILKRRLDGISNISNKQAPGKRGKPSEAQTLNATGGSETLAELLDFQAPPPDNAALSLAITTQLHVLRLLASSKKPSMITAAVPILCPDYQSSPVRLLLHSAKESSSQATKAARQLELLSQLMLSLCPNISTSDDAVAVTSKLSVMPGMALQLQTFAFRSRLSWWKLCHHQGDIENDILVPFSRCLAAFVRRSQLVSLEIYECASQSFRTIQSMIANHSYFKSEGIKSPLQSIRKLLGSLAQDTGCPNEAIEWLELVQESYSKTEVSEVQRCALTAGLLALKLHPSVSNQEFENLLIILLKGLDGPLKGDNLELDELLAEMSKARRAAISRLCKQAPESNSTLVCGISDVARQMCESLILGCPRFSIRYLGKCPDSGSAPKVIVRYEQRRKYAAKSGFHAVESAMFLLKTIQNEGRMIWETMDSTLQDCSRLLERIEGHVQDPTGEVKVPATSCFVKMSQLYFIQHLNMHRDAEGPKDAQHVRPLRRSIECVTNRSFDEKEAAQMKLKLERLADICTTIGRHDEARATLITLQKELIEGGVLSRVSTARASKFLQQAWHESGDASMLARVITSLLKLELRFGSRLEQMPFYDLQCPLEEKGLILELLLEVLFKQTKDVSKIQNEIICELLMIYDVRKFTVRRLRIMTYLLRLDSDRRRDLCDDIKNTLAISKVAAVLENSEDIGLTSYLPHLQALLSTTIELQEDHPRADLLRPHLASWYLVLETVKDYDGLTKIIDEVPEFFNHLITISDFLNMKGFSIMRVAVLRMIANLNEITRPNTCPDDLVYSYNSLGLQYLELGYSGRAGLSFDRAQLYACRNGVTPEAQIQVQLSYAEYLLAIGNLDKCKESILRAQAIALKHPDVMSPLRTMGSVQQKTHRVGLAAYAFFVHSLLALEQGAADSALAHAKRCVKLIRYSWVKISMHMKSKITAPEADNIGSLVEDIANLNVSTSLQDLSAPPQEQRLGPSAWALVCPLFKSLSHLSSVYAHNGMFQETRYYTEQAQKLVQLVDSRAYLAAALTTSGSTWLSAGKLDKASECFVEAKELISSLGATHTAVLLNCQFGRLHGLHNDRDAAIMAYNQAHDFLDTMTSAKYISGIDHISNPEAMLEQEMHRLSLKSTKPGPSRKGAVTKRLPKNPISLSKDVLGLPSSISNECIKLSLLKGFLLRQKAGAFMLWRQCEEAVAALKEADTFSRQELDAIDQHISIAKQLLLQSTEQMSTDPVYSVLQDSTISFPAALSVSRTYTSERPPGTRISPSKKSQGIQSVRGQQRPKSSCSTSFFDKLRLAQERLSDAHLSAIKLASTATLHTLSSLLCANSILLSAAGPSLGRSPFHPNIGLCSVEITRNIVLYRERGAILDDDGASVQTTDDLHWPTMASFDSDRLRSEFALDAACFQKEYVDILPQGWTSISISLSESRQELCLTKMQVGCSPFVLRLPLGRNNSRDADEEIFDFDQGKAELLEIIELANQNSHRARELTGRGAKTAWWAERTDLDARLKDLLENIENVWLGGFRGIFTQHRPPQDMLARFQQSFSNILDKHLPSRQSANKKNRIHRVILDSRILELFIGLEEASAENCNLDEALTDLLYFVVDVLQFHGERNAYDEIDFDSIVIETHDALRAYQEAMMASSTNNEDNHTILILDKALHCFPWESLPCMEGLAVSRLPSLDCLRERIFRQQNSSLSVSSGRHYVEAASGSYILNPGGDLKMTQSTFENDLHALETWTGIIKREPTEAEMRDNLETKDIFLYFGHGSGAQYIRSKALKRLKKCAVTMLMGCSSGALNETGEFEPYGPPIDYMLAGCPALVATLWDVTDRDIDRFAKSAFEHWGLFAAQVAHNEPKSKWKGKKKTCSSTTGGDQKSLAKAVADGRKACNFRYLTAAAVCVYGIPVYLK